jgi:hypothetical protein
MQQVEDVGGQQVRFGMAQGGDECGIDAAETAIEGGDPEKVQGEREERVQRLAFPFGGEGAGRARHGVSMLIVRARRQAARPPNGRLAFESVVYRGSEACDRKFSRGAGHRFSWPAEFESGSQTTNNDRLRHA